MSRSFADLLRLEPHGPDTFVGEGLAYPWGGLYGGHIVAQALRAAATTVDEGMAPHSLRAYFIRPGDNTQTVRYEVDRIRNGRSFCTRRVVARQSIGAILNLEASFQRPEESATVVTVAAPASLPTPGDAEAESSWSPYFERRMLRYDSDAFAGRTGAGHVGGWYRMPDVVGDDTVLHMCAVAYLSDDLPTDSVVQAVPEFRDAAKRRAQTGEDLLFSASLDHTVWFHRVPRADDWHFYEASCHGFVSSRGISYGYVFDSSGDHVATVAQEVLLRHAGR
jgi:acyl-CoA thioesterase-2